MAIVSMSYAEMNPKSADEITYDNTTSGLEADNVQDAIDELNIHQIAEYKATLPSGYVWADPGTENNAILRIVRLGNLRVSQPCLIALNPYSGTQFDFVHIKILTIDPIDRPSNDLWSNVWTFQNGTVEPNFFDYNIKTNGEVTFRSRTSNKNLAWFPSFVWTVN